jgi:lysophospholipase L1-like esterase
MYLQEPLEVTGGWWRDGALTQGMADYLDPATADALVVMGGTNDIIRGIPKQATLANIARIVGEVDVDLVAICAVPPWSGSPPASSALNAALAQQADQNGWIFVDPWAEYRSGDTWAAGGSPDGVHGSAAAYEAAGRAITEAVEDGLG